jgi:hypothetical protein
MKGFASEVAPVRDGLYVRMNEGGSRVRAENEIKSGHFSGPAFREAKLWLLFRLESAACSPSALVRKALKVLGIDAPPPADPQRALNRR